MVWTVVVVVVELGHDVTAGGFRRHVQRLAEHHGVICVSHGDRHAGEPTHASDVAVRQREAVRNQHELGIRMALSFAALIAYDTFDRAGRARWFWLSAGAFTSNR